MLYESFMGRYFSVSYTSLKKGRKDLDENELIDIAAQETADFFEMAKSDVMIELEIEPVTI